MPDALKFNEFGVWWDRWVAHRTEIRKPLKPTQVYSQLAMLEGIGTERAVAMIRHTIEKGWQGLREPETNGQGHNSTKDVAF